MPSVPFQRSRSGSERDGHVVRHDGGLGEVTGRPEALLQPIEEFSVEVDGLVGRAIKIPSLTAQRRTPTVPRWHKKQVWAACSQG